VISDADPRASRPSGGRRFLPLAAILVALVLCFAFRVDRYLSFQSLASHREWLLEQVARLGPAAGPVFAALYAVVTALSIPGAIIFSITAGFLFGTVVGATWNVIGATLGATAIFLAARFAFGDVLRNRAGPWIAKLESGFRENALSYLLFLRLVPLFPFWLVNLVPAFLGVRLGTYILATFVGIIPAALVYASIGSGLGALLERGETPDAGAILQPRVLLPILALAALSLIPVFYKRLRRARPAEAPHGTD
jgi:uncharacterized membrane protein YdjX (TVP38/TMEM64 family)